jgi:hypothetical protein
VPEGLLDLALDLAVDAVDRLADVGFLQAPLDVDADFVADLLGLVEGRPDDEEIDRCEEPDRHQKPDNARG